MTQGQYEQVMERIPPISLRAGAAKDAVAGMDTANHPVDLVMNDAAEFCTTLSENDNLKPFYLCGETVTMLAGTGYRLPTEAEGSLPVVRAPRRGIGPVTRTKM